MALRSWISRDKWESGTIVEVNAGTFGVNITYQPNPNSSLRHVAIDRDEAQNIDLADAAPGQEFHVLISPNNFVIAAMIGHRTVLDRRVVSDAKLRSQFG